MNRRPLTKTQKEERSKALLKFWNSKRGKKQKKKYSTAMSAKWTPEARKIQSQKHTEFWEGIDKTEYERRREVMKVASKAAQNKRTRTKKKRCRADPTYDSERIQKSLRSREMSLPEKKLEKIINYLNLNYKYVGDGKLMVGRYCPDFADVDNKSIIEMFGELHSKKSGVMKMKKYDKDRIAFIEQQGYSVLVIWQNELTDVLSVVRKIQRFV